MNEFLTYVGSLLSAGWLSLLDYLAAHVLLCLVPAFVISGFMDTMIPKGAVTRFLGPGAKKWISYPASALGGFILAVCSCTILPLFAGIWKRGAGLGPAITFLFVGPAINILAITYTGAAIGMDIALARVALSIIFGIVIGLLMAWFFRREESQRLSDLQADGAFDGTVEVKKSVWILFALLAAVLIVGTLQISPLTHPLLKFDLGSLVPTWLAKGLGFLGLNLQGAVLILLLVVIGVACWKGFEKIDAGLNRWSYLALWLIAFTILFAALKEETGSFSLFLTGRSLAMLVLLALVWRFARVYLGAEEITEWIWETWKFVKQIFPLLIVGVFIAGMARVIVPENWVRAIAGRNTLLANFFGVVFGVLMYFPTLVEVPIAKMFLDLGMARGPLLAYLLSDPELSLQSVMVLNKVMGRQKTAAYVGLVALFCTLAGYFFGILLTVIK